jgi:dihydroorotase
MTRRLDLVVRGGTCVLPGGIARADVGVAEGRIAEVGDLVSVDAATTLDATGLHVLPGVIDPHVHLREPGLEHKEDIATGTAAALLGGVTAVFDMPNTRPATTSAGTLADKLARARRRAFCDVAFFVGATGENTEDLAALEASPGCAAVKLFMGSSTGSLLVSDDEAVEAVLRSGRRRVAVHAEDEGRLRERRASFAVPGHPESHPGWRDAESAALATRRVLALARRVGRPIHLLHATTAEEMELLATARDIATVEVTPQHLSLEAPACYERLGTLAQMNPPIRDAHHRAALWRAVRSGHVDSLGSDHAPHTREEKATRYPESPSGMPGVQTSLPLMLDHVSRGKLGLERLVELMCAGPARVWAIADKGRIVPGFDADLTLVDLAHRETITNAWIRSRCRWTPFDGREVVGWPVATVLRGRIVMRDGELLGPPSGEPVRFSA